MSPTCSGSVFTTERRPAPQQPRERLRLRCRAMVHGGACLASAPAHGTVLIDGAIPGELVVAELLGRRGGALRARVVEVLEPSPDRVTPPCPYVPECGGCDLQHVSAARQLVLKRDIVLDALRRQDVSIAEPVAVHGMDDPWRYRWRGEFHVIPPRTDAADGETAPLPGLGFNRARSWRPVAVDDCLIHHRTIGAALPRLRRLAAGARSRLDVLRLTVGEDGDELLVEPRPTRALDPAHIDAAALAVEPGAARWVTQATTLRWKSHRLRVSSESFIQVNQSQADVLYQCVLDNLGDISGACVVDAYAGVGALAVELAARIGEGGEVVCIEENRAAAAMAVLNARLNSVEQRVRVVPRSVEDALGDTVDAATVDALVLDPPRAGCAGSITGLVALCGPARVVYVSCDPATLARDLHVLVSRGPYSLTALDIVDMFPQTHHIESVACLVREPGAAAQVE